MTRRILRTCICCAWKRYMADRDGDEPQQTICDDCSQHYEMKLEPVERALARESAHAVLWKQNAETIGAAYERVVIELDDEKLAAFNARETRRRYGLILDDLSDLHQRGERRRCTCGLASPCETGTILEHRYGRTYARRKVSAEAERQRLIDAGRPHSGR